MVVSQAKTLGVIDFAQVKDVVLSDLATAVAAGFDDGPGTVDLAVLASGAALEEHEDRLSGFLRLTERGLVATTRTFGSRLLENRTAFAKSHA
jgi:hypothetical protein